VVLNLVAGCRWNSGLDKLLTILTMKPLRRQLTVDIAAQNVYLYKFLCLVHYFFYYLLLSLPNISFICVSPTGSVYNTQPFANNKELKDNLLEASNYTNRIF
jgi:hypothetical protein